MTPTTLRQQQLEMTSYLRDPDNNPAPAGVEARRLKIYEELVYNNIEGFISRGFPVLRSLYQDDDWYGLVRQFIDQHRCHTPYFLEISQEFLTFLMETFTPRDCDPPFLLELAHYEWVEVALDVSTQTLDESVVPEDGILTLVPRLSPLAWLLSYEYPVHLIGPDSQPGAPGETTFLVVYRDRQDRVQFVALNAATARLLALVRDNQSANCETLLSSLAAELAMGVDAMLDFGSGQLAEFVDLGVIIVNQNPDGVVSSVAPASAAE